MSGSPIDKILGAIESSPDDPGVSNFARGLVLGALVGAAIAGSTIWQRRRGRAASAPSRRPSGSPSAAAAAAPERREEPIAPS